MRAVPSSLAVATRESSGAHVTDSSVFVWPTSLTSSFPDLASQIRAVASWLPVNTFVPSFDQSRLEIGTVCPVRVASKVPLRTSQTCALFLAFDATIRLPSGDHLARGAVLPASKPGNCWTILPLCASHI